MKKIIYIIITFMIGANLYAEEVNKQNVAGEIANPEREKADGIFYAKIGYGAVFGKFNNKGGGVGFGYRHEKGVLAWDFGFLNCIIPNSEIRMKGEGSSAYSNNLVQIQALYLFSPVEKKSFYAGGGFAYSIITAKDYSPPWYSYYTHNDIEYCMVHEDIHEYSFKGIAGIATFGYEIMRERTSRLFIQLEATMPFGKIKNENRNDSYYGWVLALSMGIGF